MESYKALDRSKEVGSTHSLLTKGMVPGIIYGNGSEPTKIALEDKYFIEKKLYPNVDFYSGIILKALGFPTSMFTVLFAIGRTVGWISQWKEMIEDPINKIGRPRQLYSGQKAREYQILDSRENKSIFQWLWKK